MVAFGGKLLLVIYGNNLAAFGMSAVVRLSASWRVSHGRFHCATITIDFSRIFLFQYHWYTINCTGVSLAKLSNLCVAGSNHHFFLHHACYPM